MKTKKTKYYYIGKVDGFAVETGYNATHIKKKLVNNYPDAKRIDVECFRICDNGLFPAFSRVIKSEGLKV